MDVRPNVLTVGTGILNLGPNNLTMGTGKMSACSWHLPGKPEETFKKSETRRREGFSGFKVPRFDG
jgi:hypothetical protein